jgi:hypothetical protein
MAVPTTLITLYDELKVFCDGHYQIKRFEFEYEEQLPNLSTEGKEFPLVFVTPISYNPNGNMNVHTVRLYAYNRINRDRTNVLDSTNDTSLIISDLIKWWNGYNFNSNIELLNEPIALPLNNDKLDYLQGYYADFEFELPSYSRCDIPIPGGTAQVIDQVSTFVPYLTCASLADCVTFTDLADLVDINIIDITNLQNDLSALDGRVSTNETDITNLDTRVTINENDISTLENDLLGYLPLTGGIITGDLTVSGDFEVLGTMTTINTEIIQAKDNNIDLNYDGTHLSAEGGGITIIDGVSTGNDSQWLINGDGDWYTNQSIGIDSTSQINLANDLAQDNYITSDATYNSYYHNGQAILQNGNTLRLNNMFYTGLISAYFNTNTRIGQPTGYDTIFEDDSTNPLMTIKQSGDIGIGISTPEENLHLSGPGQVAAFIDGDTGGGANDDVYLRLRSRNTHDWSVGINADDFHIANGNGLATPFITALNNGNVGIGTTTPATELDVDGEITVAIERWTIDLMESLSTTIYADEAISITLVEDIVSTPTITLLVNSSAYTLGDPIASSDRIDIISSTQSVIKLKIEK